ncbi:MAG TPA: ribosome maturation factor RimM [Gemmatimonadaceae bacterium]|nr:ribosome maturation factor RimM [Gemmatimonadaceae bacterium]
MTEYAIVGRIRKAHGTRGEVVVEPITDAPEAVFASGRRVFAGSVDGDLSARPGDPRPGRAAPHELLVRSSRAVHGGALLVIFDAIPDRAEAERWRDRYLLAPVAELRPPGESQVYYHDLLGMAAETAGGESLGPVVDLYDAPQGLLLEVELAGGRRVLIPYRPEVVTAVDVGARRLTVEPPEGLLD